jgi:hypothetical protein
MRTEWPSTTDEINDDLDNLIKKYGVQEVKSHAWRKLNTAIMPISEAEQRYWAAVSQRLRKPWTALDRLAEI